MRKNYLLAALLAGCVVAAVGCSSQNSQKETEDKKPVETAAARETEAPAKAETEAAAAETEAAAAETEAAAAETEAAAVETEAAAAETEAAAAETEAAAVETEAAAAETEAAAAETEAAAAETEAAAVETEAAAAETEAEGSAETEAEAAAAGTEAEPAETEAESGVEIVAVIPETESEDFAETEPYDYYETEPYDYYETESETEPISMPEYDISDYLEIKDEKYKDIKVQVPPAQKVTDEEVKAEIENAFQYLEDYDDLVDKKTTGVVADGDTVNIDYVGTKDGEEFDGGSAEGYDLEIGSGSFIDGFEEGLVGKKIGSELDLNLTFPEDYGVEELNGADVVFHVTLNYVAEMPELTDDLASKLSGGEYSTVDEYVESVRADLQSGYDEEYKNNAYSQIMLALNDLYSPEEYPEENIEYIIKKLMEQYIEPYASMYGMSVKDFIATAYNGLTEEEFREQELIPAAQTNLNQEMILGAIAEKAGITMTDEELEELLQGYADEYGITVEELTKGTDMETIRSSELQQKVMEWLFENVTVEEVEETESAGLFGNETEAEIGAETEAEIGDETEAETEAFAASGKETEAETAAETEETASEKETAKESVKETKKESGKEAKKASETEAGKASGKADGTKEKETKK